MECNITLSDSVTIIQLVLYVPVLICGVMFNALGLWVFSYKIKTWTESRVYMINLIISDCILTCTLPFRIYSYIWPWELSKALCSGIVSLYFLNTYMSIFIITLISVDRYAAILHPLRAKRWRSPMRSAALCVLLWIGLFAVLTYLLLRDNFDRDHQVCFQKTFTRPLKRRLLFSIFGFLVPSLAEIFCSIQIIRRLKKIGTVTPEGPGPARKATQIISINLTVFIACFLPVHAGYLARFVLESIDSRCSVIQSANTFDHVATLVSNLNCCLDAACYYFVAKEFWEATSLLPKLRNQTFDHRVKCTCCIGLNFCLSDPAPAQDTNKQRKPKENLPLV
ncbi:G-protein coupled receptor 35-like [Ascaphus truei]|uniref:G-protein coupled receptor 35-like n=1 Tax=Ascaphus truei TaxID=8439 RepID=UPI003F59A00D